MGMGHEMIAVVWFEDYMHGYSAQCNVTINKVTYDELKLLIEKVWAEDQAIAEVWKLMVNKPDTAWLFGCTDEQAIKTGQIYDLFYNPENGLRLFDLRKEKGPYSVYMEE